MKINQLNSSELDSAIYAMILGDGSCDKGGGNFTSGSNYILKMGHSIVQEEYVFWKKKIIDQIGTVNTKIRYYDKTKSIYLYTNSRKYFTKLEKIFYKNRVKLINNKILNKLTDLSLAIWFLDDGYTSRNSSGSIYGELCTDQFSEKSVDSIVLWFKKKYNIICRTRKLIYSSGKVAHRVAFGKEALYKLYKIIEPYTNQISCMKYKIKR